MWVLVSKEIFFIKFNIETINYFFGKKKINLRGKFVGSKFTTKYINRIQKVEWVKGGLLS
jgi:hypothetical protein